MPKDQNAEPTQKTRPLGKDKKGRRAYKPADIPVPTRKEVFDLMRAVSGKRSAPGDGGSKQ